MTDLSKKHLLALHNLHKAVRRTQDLEGVQRAIVETIKPAGYEIMLSSDDDLGFPLETDQRLNGRERWGSIIPVFPESDELNEEDKVFLREYAEVSGLCIDHAHFYRTLRRKNHEMRELKGDVTHEVVGPLQILTSGYAIISNDSEIQAQRSKIALKMMGPALKQMTGLINFLRLDGKGIDELKKQASSFSIEKIAREQATMYDQIMKEKGLGLYLKFDRIAESELQLYSNKEAFMWILGNLIGNSLVYSENGSRINEGIKVKDDNLEFIMENQIGTEKRRLNIGFGSGRGLPMTKSLVQELGGEFRKYKKSQISRDYEFCEQYGDATTTYNPESEIFGVKITFPMKELTFHPPRKQ